MPDRRRAASGYALLPGLFFPGDQERQLERVGEPEPGKLLRRRLCDEQVLVLERPAEDRSRVALRGRRSSSLGPTGDRF
jgi:hypothetical protein